MTSCVCDINVDRCLHACAIGAYECLVIVIAITNDLVDGIVEPDPATAAILLALHALNFFSNSWAHSFNRETST